LETSIRSYNRRSNRTFSFFLTGFLLKHHAQAVRVSVYKGSFYYAAFLALLKELRTALALTKGRGKQLSTPGAAAPRSVVRLKLPSILQVRARASVKPTSW